MIIGLPIGILQSNCYLVYGEESGEGIVIDPGGDTAPLLEKIKEHNVQVRYVLNTHGHFDHIAGNADLEAVLHVPFGLHPADQALLMEGGGAAWFDVAYVPAPKPTLTLTDGLILEVGNFQIRVIHTPGHSPGSVCFYIPEENALITGDTLFAGSVGRTDLPGGDARSLTESLKRIVRLVPPQTTIYPGHGHTNRLSAERRGNPWLKWIANET